MDRIAQLRTFIAQKQGEPFPRYALALELKAQGDTAGAVAELRELLRNTPDYLAAYLQLGMLLQAQSQPAEARQVLEAGQAVARSKGDSHTLSELTAALESL